MSGLYVGVRVQRYYRNTNEWRYGIIVRLNPSGVYNT